LFPSRDDGGNGRTGDNVFNNKFFRSGWYFDEPADKGGGTPPPAKPPDGTPPGQAGAGDGDKKSFTQAELDALFGARAKQAADKATADLLAALGVKSADEIKAALAKAKELEDAQLGELEKAKKLAASEKERADAAETAKTEALAQAGEKLLKAAVIAEAATAGFNDPNDAWLYVDRSTIVEKDGSNYTGVKEAVGAVAKSKAYLLKTLRPSIGTPLRDAKRGAGGDQAPQPAKVRL
jgi:hypothetical protein